MIGFRFLLGSQAQEERPGPLQVIHHGVPGWIFVPAPVQVQVMFGVQTGTPESQYMDSICLDRHELWKIVGPVCTIYGGLSTKYGRN